MSVEVKYIFFFKRATNSKKFNEEAYEEAYEDTNEN